MQMNVHVDNDCNYILSDEGTISILIRIMEVGQELLPDISLSAVSMVSPYRSSNSNLLRI